ncbi:MAG: CPBP family intramembrane glutamic endopeptidase [Polyangiaceae bacterium]
MSNEPEVLIAPRWHTALLVLLLLSVALCGTLLQHYAAPTLAPSAAKNSLIANQYLPLLAVNGGLVLYTCRLFRGRNALPSLLGQRWGSARRAALDLALALLACVLIQGLEAVTVQYLGSGRNAAVSALLPRTEAERLAWVLVAVCVGVCEEVVYRGYLQTQLAAFTGSVRWGVALQAVLFGIAHAEQGGGSALRIAGYGLVFGVLAQLRRSLLPSIVSHVIIDLAAGFWR